MRPVMHSDICAAARAVLAIPERGRPDFCARLIREAEGADRFVRRLGKLHPIWGNGTLKSAAHAYRLTDEPSFDDPAYARAFAMVLSKLIIRKNGVGLVT